MSSDSGNTPSPRSPASRVSIDGAKIKFIRESKGLTQLYVATFLGVTPDTVSRWENRKYPTVKWENVEKLGEALSIDPTEILDTSHASQPLPAEDSADQPAAVPSAEQSRRFVISLMIVLLALIVLAAAFFLRPGNDVEITITATRFLPRHAPAGQPFPVVVRVDSSSVEPFSFILQEKLPTNATVLAGLPDMISQDQDNTIKWISNARETPFYLAYLVRAAPGRHSSEKMTFTGEIKVDNAPRSRQQVLGDSVLELSNYHWVDSNSDGIITDEEILMVYSSEDVLTRLGVDMDNIKKIWSAGGYAWDPQANEYSITSRREDSQ